MQHNFKFFLCENLVWGQLNMDLGWKIENYDDHINKLINGKAKYRYHPQSNDIVINFTTTRRDNNNTLPYACTYEKSIKINLVYLKLALIKSVN